MPGDEISNRQAQSAGPSRWKKLFFALVVTVGFFLALEIVLAIAGVSPFIVQQDPLVGFDESLPLFVEDQQDSALLTTATNKLAHFNAQSFPRTKATGTRRIFCLGGSTTHGRPYDDATSYAGWLRELLPLADPAHHWEVINAGGVSYASYRLAAVSEQLVTLQPDLLIIYTGHNEFLEELSYPELKNRSRLLKQATLLAARSRVFTLLFKGLKTIPGSRGQPTMLDGEVDEILNHTVGPSSYKRNDQLRGQVIDFFQLNLLRIIQLAQQHDVAVVLVTPAANLRDFSPFKSQHSDGLSESDQQHWQQLTEQAQVLAIQQQWPEATTLLKQAVAINERHADTHFQLAAALQAQQQYERALAHYQRAVDEDVCPLRAISPLVQSVRQIAANESIPLVDFEKLVADKCLENNKHVIPGSDFFLDHVHPTILSHRMLAEAIIDRLEAENWWKAVGRLNQADRERVSQRLLDSIDQDDHARARRNLAKVLNWSGKQMEAGVLAVSSLEQLPNDPEALSIAAAYMRQLGRRDRAIQYLERRTRLTPDDVDSLRRLASLLVEEGRMESALVHYQHVLELSQQDAQAYHHLGMVLAELNRFAEATDHYRKALEHDESDANIHYHLGIALAETGDLKGSRASFRQALTLDPDDNDAAFNLAVILGQLGQQLEAGDPARARKHYQSALELNPAMIDIQERLERLRLKDKSETCPGG